MNEARGLKGLLKLVLPHRIGGQILLLVMVSVVLTQALNFGVLFASDQGRREAGQLRTGLGIFVTAVRMVAAAAPDDWPSIVAIVRNTAPGIHFSYQADAPWSGASADDSGMLSFITRDLGPGFELNESPPKPGVPGGGMRTLSVLLPNHAVVSARMPVPDGVPRPIFPAWNLFIFALVFLPLTYFWAAWGLSRQLNNFARAAGDFSLEGAHKQLPETGPEEIQQVARALNRMRDRIMELLSDRTRMLSAIGHDLRTPITRLRLRAEFIEDEHTRLDILRDLERMNRMVNSALTYIRDGMETERPVPIDLPALLRTVTDNFIDAGERLSYEGDEHLSIKAQPDAMVRAVENLIENGLKYGSHVVVRSERRDGDRIAIEVEDDGVGISADKREAMLEPFVRGDAARNSAAGGFGLGLSITAAIAKSHGGELQLAHGEMGGLLARLVLPANNDASPADE
ncbi:MAG TPA: ATP-binding protein [Devosiaceae bacterium]|nr:ATP-binding protein [Devosiaceae bacterium]